MRHACKQLSAQRRKVVAFGWLGRMASEAAGADRDGHSGVHRAQERWCNLLPWHSGGRRQREEAAVVPPGQTDSPPRSRPTPRRCCQRPEWRHRRWRCRRCWPPGRHQAPRIHLSSSRRSCHHCPRSSATPDCYSWCLRSSAWAYKIFPQLISLEGWRHHRLIVNIIKKPFKLIKK